MFLVAVATATPVVSAACCLYIFFFPDPGASSRVIDAFGELGNGGSYSEAKQIDIDIEPN